MAVLNENVLDLFRKRYFLKDQNGNLLENSWEELCERVATNISLAEKEELREYYKKLFYKMMENMEFIPSSPCLFNAGTKTQQLSSCFIIDVEDNVESIFGGIAECAKIFQKMGGAGFNASKIRPIGSIVNSSNGIASGVVSFMRIYDETVEQMKNKNNRRGAMKIDLNDNHPEIFRFIHCKDNKDQLKNMNISVSLSDKFMYAVQNDDDWELTFNGKVRQVVKARDLFNEIAESAWKTGDPGVCFRDRMEIDNMNKHLGQIEGSNPCMEFTNIPYSSCNLGSINLTKMVRFNKETNKYELDKDKLKETVSLAVRFLDDMITINKLPLPKIQEVTEKIRPIGLGIMGFADLLYLLEIPYNSQEGFNFAKDLIFSIKYYALEENQKLAEKKGAYPAWEGSEWQKNNIRVRCSNMLSIAPNGSIGFIANVNGGIEPCFALVYQRETNDGVKYFVVNEVFKKALEKEGIYSDELIEKIFNEGTIQNIEEIPDYMKKIFITANDIHYSDHIKMVGVFQKHVDLSISKTVNLPSSATVEDIKNIYMQAWQNGLKGITIYRDGSLDNQVLTTGNYKKSKENPNSENDLPWGLVLKASDDLIGKKRKLTTGCGSLHCLGFFDPIDGKLLETYLSKGSSGGCNNYMVALSRMISLAARTGAKTDDIVDQLESAGICGSYAVRTATKHDTSKGSCCPMAVGYALLDMQQKY